MCVAHCSPTTSSTHSPPPTISPYVKINWSCAVLWGFAELTNAEWRRTTTGDNDNYQKSRMTNFLCPTSYRRQKIMFGGVGLLLFISTPNRFYEHHTTTTSEMTMSSVHSVYYFYALLLIDICPSIMNRWYATWQLFIFHVWSNSCLVFLSLNTDGVLYFVLSVRIKWSWALANYI